MAFFARHPVFAYEEYVAAFEHGRTRRTVETLLAYHLRVGHVVRLRRGLFATVPLGLEDPNALQVDPFVVAAKLTDDAVLGYHTALALAGKAYSVHQRFVVITSRAVRPFAFHDNEIVAVAPPTTLVRRKKVAVGVMQADRSGTPIRVTSLERTLVDVLDRPDLGGGWEEIWRSLESVEFFDIDRVVEYAKLLDNATTTAKVGFYLEQHREPLMIDDAVLKRLRRGRPRQPVYMDRKHTGPSKLITGWNLIVPQQVIDRAWGEVA
jgi:predicted transcriptional regulator of viral defense system